MRTKSLKLNFKLFPGYFLRMINCFQLKNLARQKGALNFREYIEALEMNAALLDAYPDLLFIFDKDCKFIDFRGNEKELLFPPEHFLGKKVDEILPEKVANLTKEKMNILFATGEMQIYNYDLEINGQQKAFESRLVMYGKDKALSIVRNITERKMFESTVQSSQKRYRELYNLFRVLADSTPDMIWAKDLEKKFLFVNKAICTDLLNAVDTDEPIGKTDMFFAQREREQHPENPQWHTFGEICVDSDAITLREMRPMQFDEYGNVKGKFLFLDVHKAPLYDLDGKLIGVVGTARNITAQKEIEEKLSHSEETYKGIINSLSECLYIIDENGVVIDANEKAFSELACESKDLLGQSLNSLFAPGRNDWETIMDHLEDVLQGKNYQFECYSIRKDGTIFPKHISLSPGKYHGKPCVIALSRDFTEQKRIEKSLIEAKEKAEESDKLKSAFLANMSHEARIPLNGIIGFSEFLAEGNVSLNQVKQYGAIILASATRMLEYMNNVLDISKIEAGVEEIVLSDFSIVSLIEEVVLSFRNMAINKNLTISAEFAPECKNMIIQSDFNKIQRILANLLDNAIKFTSQGSVTVRCKKEDKFITFEVEDTGSGISEEHLMRIFERFYQANLNLNRGWEGAGLGLSIVKGLVEVLGGQIWVKSQVGQGSTFKFSVPYVEGKWVLPEESLKKDFDISGQPKVLVVEDDDSSYQYIEVLLTNLGCQVLRASTGTAAIKIFDQNDDIDLVLLDIKIPELDGTEVMKWMKQRRPNTPIIAQTAYAMVGDRERLISEGFDEYIAKPIRSNQLAKLLHKYFLNRKD